MRDASCWRCVEDGREDGALLRAVVSVVSGVVMVANSEISRNAGWRACHTIRGRESPAAGRVQRVL
jgi:hypothetical protein